MEQTRRNIGQPSDFFDRRCFNPLLRQNGITSRDQTLPVISLMCPSFLRFCLVNHTNIITKERTLCQGRPNKSSRHLERMPVIPSLCSIVILSAAKDLARCAQDDRRDLSHVRSRKVL